MARGLIEIVFQTILAFASILLYTRILGKQQIGQLTPFEYVTGITFGSIAGVLATDIGIRHTWHHFLGLSVFTMLTFSMGHLSMISRPARKLLDGEPTVVIHNGRILEENMRKMRYNLDELQMQLREKSVFNIGEVEYALLEPNGNLAVLLKSQHRPLTPADLGIPTAYEGIQSELVMDGEIVHQNLRQLGLDENWLKQELGKKGVSDLNEVFYAAVDTRGRLYVDVRKDRLQTPVDITDQPKS